MFVKREWCCECWALGEGKLGDMGRDKGKVGGLLPPKFEPKRGS